MRNSNNYRSLHFVLLAFFTFSCVPTVLGQDTFNHLKRAVEQSALVVEAEVISSESFWNEERTRIFTGHLVEVKNLYKGELNSAMVEILTIGGRVDDDFLMVSHNITIGKGWKGLLFLNTLEVEGERGTAFRSSANPSYRIWDRATYYYDRINPPAVFAHSTVKDIESVLLEPLERLAAQPRTVYDSDFQRPSVRIEQVVRDFIESIELAPSDPTAASSSTTIEYLIDNPQLTGTWPMYLEFDLTAKCNVPGTDFAKGEIWVNYNIDAFGPSIAGSGYLTWTEESFLATGDYTVFAEDLAIDKVKLKVEHTGALGLADLNELPELSEALLHLKIRVNDLSQLADITFGQDSMDEKSKYRDASRANGLYPYDIVIAVDEQEFFIANEGYHDLSYRFENETVVEINGEHWFETEVMAKSDSDGVLLAQSVILIDIDETVFAPVQTAGNWEMIAFGLSTAPNVVFDNDPQVSSDMLRLEVSDTLAEINELITYPPVAMYLTQSWQPLYKLRIKIDACNQPANLSLNNIATQNSLNAYWIPNSLYIWPFEPISAIDTFNVVVCPDSIPVIYSVSPKVITAGTFDTLTINGANFGNFPGGVFFENGDVGISTGSFDWVQAYNQDVIWTDSIIKTTVPSSGYNIGASFTWGNSAGSGVVRLDVPGTPPSSYLETEHVEIRYSVFNARFADTSSVSIVLGDRNGLGGYTFQYDSSVPDSAKIAIDNALLQWNCATNVNFVMGADVSVSGSGIDGVNSIRFGHPSEFDSDSALAFVLVKSGRLDTCIGFDTPFLYVNEIDLVFRSSVDWHYSITNNPDTPKVDLLFVALHELGHAHQLDHVLDSNKVMFYRNTIDPPRLLQSADIEGGLYLMNLSTIEQCVPFDQAMEPLEIDCGGSPQDIGETSASENGLKLWPNPSSDYLNLNFLSEKNGVGTLAISNVLGQNVIEKSKLQFNRGENILQLDINGLNSGIYMIVIQHDGHFFSSKFIKRTR